MLPTFLFVENLFDFKSGSTSDIFCWVSVVVGEVEMSHGIQVRGEGRTFDGPTKQSITTSQVYCVTSKHVILGGW